MKILVTGGAGFIGSHLLQLLLNKENTETIVYDNLSSGRAEHVPAAASMKLIVGDVCAENLEKIFAAEKFDAVIHLAAQTMVPYSLAHPAEDCRVNLLGLINILECCRKYAVGHIVFSSSAAVYGDNPRIPLDEEEKLLPTSAYGITKMTSEHYLRIYHDLYNINATVLRFANVYGERQGAGGEGGVVSIFCQRLAAGKGVSVFGTGEQTRDFVYAGDIAEALWRGAQLDGFHTINVSTQKETAVNELVSAFVAATGRNFPVTHEAPRAGDIFRSVLANARCRKELGFTPQMDLQAGIARTYQDYLQKFEGGK